MRYLFPMLLVLFSLSPAAAQTEESVQYIITTPSGATLALGGTLTLPANLKKPVPVVLLIAGSGPTDRDCNSAAGLKTDAFRMLADSLRQQGIGVLRYDKRYSGTNLAQAVTLLPVADHRFELYVQDAVGFVRQLQGDKRFSRVIVAGHSEGSLVGMLAARQISAAGFVSIAGAGQNIADVLHTQLASLADTLRRSAYRTLDTLRSGQLSPGYPRLLGSLLRPDLQPYLISWMRYDPAVEIKTFRGLVLIINGKRDVQVAVSEAERLQAARPDAQLRLFDQMTHVLKNADSDSRESSLKTYNDPSLPLTPGLATAIARFVSSTGQ
jgi:uncharacterized protein